MFHVSHHLFQPKFLYVFFVSFDGLFDVLSIFFFFLGGGDIPYDTITVISDHQ